MMSKAAWGPALLEVMVAVQQGSVWAEYRCLQSGYGESHKDIEKKYRT